MEITSSPDYYKTNKVRFLADFDREAAAWHTVLAAQSGLELADAVLGEARRQFIELLARLPYIGGEDNRFTGALVEAAGCLALYLVLKKRGWVAEKAAKVMYDALLLPGDVSPPAIPPAKLLTPEQLMERRKTDAERSQERRYAGDYVYEFVPGTGIDFDYGYNFLACASLQLYQALDAREFAPFYCYLDFPKSRLGLRRVHTLAEGDPLCDHRFKFGRAVEFGWPPPFVKNT